MTHYVHALNASARFFEHRPGVLSRLARLLILALRIRHERARLAELDDTRLADLGISRDAARREAARGFLDIPAHRKSALHL
ncbi:hypothetical protein L2D14_15165 [Thalassospiraceae bacterium LMO-JJ14]|nr:hypothetical protein L2D14_15165 [Thalassospiraceae bacterium LMO-JJ14]